MHAERPEGVLVLADHAEVLTVPVDADDAPELAGVDELLHLAHAGVVDEQVAEHEATPPGLGRVEQILHLGRAQGDRLLDDDVLAGLEGLLGERVVRGHRGRDDHGVERLVTEQLVEIVGHHGVGEEAAGFGPVGLLEVAAVGELGIGQAVEVARQVRAPVAQTHHAHADLVTHVASPSSGAARGRVAGALGRAPAQSFQTFPVLGRPAVALRRSTTSGACSTSARSRRSCAR